MREVLDHTFTDAATLLESGEALVEIRDLP
jgi:hypothetical protein